MYAVLYSKKSILGVHLPGTAAHRDFSNIELRVFEGDVKNEKTGPIGPVPWKQGGQPACT